jgi:hypothetical protein
VTLTDLQWGRILALMWLEPEFKVDFEKDPVQAFRRLREPARKAALGKKYGDFILADLGLESDDISLTNFEVMSWDGVDFWGMPGAQLHDCIQGKNIDDMKPDESAWFWNSRSKSALGAEPNTLTARDWVRIYARIWMDYRFDDFKNALIGKSDEEIEKDEDLKLAKTIVDHYGPTKKGYVEEFDKNPAATVQRIKDEFDQKKWDPINYKPETTRLFTVIHPPANSGLENLTLNDLDRTGNVRNHPLKWILKKC